MLPTPRPPMLRAARSLFLASVADCTGATAATPAAAAPISLVKTLNAATADAGPTPVVGLAGAGYFLAQSGQKQLNDTDDAYDLFRTDGTSGGTALVETLPHPAGTQPHDLTVAGSTLYFTHRSNAADLTDTVLWSSDGTPGATAPLAWTPADGAATHAVRIVANDGADLYFTATSSDPGMTDQTLYRLPGGATTAAVITHAAGTIRQVAVASDGTLFYTVDAADATTALWHTTGAMVGTKLLTEQTDAGPSSLVTAGTHAYFQVAGGGPAPTSLWASDGTVPGTTAVPFPTSPSAPVGVADYRVASDALYLVGYGQQFPDDPAGAADVPIWRVVGTTTTAVTTSATHVAPTLGQAIGSSLYFTAGADQRELWRTVAGASPTEVTAHDPSDASGSVSVVGTDGASIFFVDHGSELWSTDGTPGGAVQLADTYAEYDNVGGGASTSFTTIGSTTYFPEQDAVTGAELWAADGTASSAHLIEDLNPQTLDAGIDHAVSMGGAMYFTAVDGRGFMSKLWRSDGTGAGTTLIADLGRDRVTRVVATPTALAITTLSRRLWWSDGTPQGTSRLDVTTAADDFSAFDPSPFGNKVVFTGPGIDAPVALWITDGTVDGTSHVTDLPSDPALAADDYEPTYISAGSQVYFTGYDAAHGFELWHSNGTPGGTGLVQDLNPGPGNDPLLAFAPAGDHLAFVANDAQGNPQVWRTNASGTAATAITRDAFSSPPQNLVADAGNVFFSVDDHLWRTDGNADDRCPVLGADGLITSVAAFGTGVVFTDLSGAVSQASSTDAPATVLRRFSGGVFPPVTARSGLFFVGASGTTGAELWHSDGTPTGTAIVEDLQPGTGSSNPSSLTISGDNLLFAAEQGLGGQQLFGTTLGNPIAPPATALPPCLDRNAVPPTPAPKVVPEPTPSPAPVVTPGPAPTPTSAPGQAGPGPGPRPVVKVTPTQLTITAAHQRDRRAPFTFTFVGRLKLPAGGLATATCSGNVTIAIRRGARTVATAAAALSRAGQAACRYRVTVAVPRSALGTGGTLQAIATFGGTATIEPMSPTRQVAVHYGH